MNPQGDSFRNRVVGQLERPPGLRSRSMFGGFNLYSGDRFFGLVCERHLCFRTGDDTGAACTAARTSFPSPNPKQSLKNCFEVPADILEDHGSLVTWVEATSKHSI